MKGLNSAINILKHIRKIDPRFTLHVCGSHKLWGELEVPAKQEEGVIQHGTIGQKKLANLSWQISII